MKDKDSLPEVSSESIANISHIMEHVEVTKKVGRELLTDESIDTTSKLINAIKNDTIPGSSFIEWFDGNGKLRVNVIDFIVEDKLRAIDPDNGDSVIVKSSDIPDGSWRVLY